MSNHIKFIEHSLNNVSTYARWEDDNVKLLHNEDMIASYMRNIAMGMGNLLHITMVYTKNSSNGHTRAFINYKDHKDIIPEATSMNKDETDKWLRLMHKDRDRICMSFNSKFNRRTMNPVENNIIKELHSPRELQFDDLMEELKLKMDRDISTFDRMTGLFLCEKPSIHTVKYYSYISSICDGRYIIAQNVLESVKLWFRRLHNCKDLDDNTGIRMEKSIFSTTLVGVVRDKFITNMKPSNHTFTAYSYPHGIERNPVNDQVYAHDISNMEVVSVFSDKEEDGTISKSSLPLAMHWNKSLEIPNDIDYYVKHMGKPNNLRTIIEITAKLISSNNFDRIPDLLFYGNCDFIDAFLISLLRCLKLSRMSLIENYSINDKYLKAMTSNYADMLVLRDFILESSYLTSGYIKRLVDSHRYIMCTTPRMPTTREVSRSYMDKFNGRFVMCEGLSCDKKPLEVRRYVEANFIGIARWFTGNL